MAKEDDDKWLEELTGKTRKEIEKEFRESLKRMGILEKMDRATELDDESRRRRRQLGEPTEKKLRNKPTRWGKTKKKNAIKENKKTKRNVTYPSTLAPQLKKIDRVYLSSDFEFLSFEGNVHICTS